jgi:diaminopimelate epimerase
MRFAKMHGLGNDFVLVDAIDDPGLAKRAQSAATFLCDRRLGIGSDGLLIAVRATAAPFEMVMLNPDGSPATCGNGLRCFARFLRMQGRTDRSEFTVETLGRLTQVRIFPSEDVANGEVEVDMGPPRLLRREIPMLGKPDEKVVDEELVVDGKAFRVTCVSMGNPHCVTFVDDPDAIDLETWGPKFENHPSFPERTNVHFVKVAGPHEHVMRVWERGAGITQACGTGACAVAVAAALSGRSERDALVRMPGGTLSIRWVPEGNILMRGMAELAFLGEIELP